ncbi:AEC family transporter [Halopseudomonas pelagia]|uniref:AEC family transporter n=1 Tax=Halopseudomonas pelagia TaxID=553151 RepID=UPI00039EE798|nr:AEC family transporter [Halopseudomonas pelagia]|tara:strand:- start:137414 stop:138322 length:909 start_codon:yes stop_codon:yes gene_type:complete
MVVVNALIPVFGLILLGYVLGWRRWVPGDAGGSLNAVTFKLFMPVLLFSGLAKADLGQALSPVLVLVYFLPALLVFGVINLIMHRRLGRPTSMGLAASYSNNVLVGIPVVTLVLGPEYLVYLFAILVFHSLLLFTAQSLYNAFWAEGDGKGLDLRDTLKSLANPLIIGLLLGALLNLSGLQVPSSLWKAVEWLAAAALPCALLVLGLSLSHYRLHMSASMGVLTLSKLVLFPLLVLLCGLAIPGLDSQARTVLVIMAACPTGVNVLAFYMGQEDSRIISSVIFLSTLLSAVTLPLWLLLLGG